ncbi:protein argonaute 2-like [Phalaenopsis equestris]|uniref:protein argonaute 2-like n=1 Tax=Phalaenopsis equestris TaxID=78828 RepID=UPI0009E2BDAD|nr:protein argonaute 2-like [Phalaenopsis equestris]
MNPFDSRYADPYSYRDRRSDLLQAPPLTATPVNPAGFHGAFYPPRSQPFPGGGSYPPFQPPHSGVLGGGRGREVDSGRGGGRGHEFGGRGRGREFGGRGRGSEFGGRGRGSEFGGRGRGGGGGRGVEVYRQRV